ncbi:hypothetical protein FHS31_001498 [Sphingomonas vulcanisoli]|uniref:Phasin family protein n=1 Tax=Sphingomonas vulcanisoli TaxID=1658060 RepID=A0ABX0TQT5_9SPHN|nr:hypothetical protein [Sphingomonas vulcanisoli]NIJ07888.1 hypothetical protein [Sphingomonas vulcanisoli]
MNDFFAPFVAMQKQLIQAHKQNVETMFKAMPKDNFGGASEAAKQLADQQIEAWEKWLALWGPKG